MIAGFFTGSSIRHVYTTICPQRTEFLCGETVAEARSLQCKVDVMDLGWVHPHCWDEEFLDEYAPPDKWRFGLDEEFRTTLSQAQISTGDFEDPWVTNNYHGAHCTYALRKMARAAALGEHVNLRMSHVRHTHHCAMSVRTIKADKFNVTGPGGVTRFRCRR